MAAAASSSSPGLFSAPAPIRALFKSFPLAVHPAEALPARSSTYDDDATNAALPRLYIFARDDEAKAGLPSYNPQCLKWQTILRIASVPVLLVPSSNHASPSGSLPFLLPPPSSNATAAALTGEKITRYAQQQNPSRTTHLDDPSPRIDAYQALIASAVRPAWLHALYVNPANDALLASLYLPASALLRAPQRHGLRAAATTEILKATRTTAGGVDAPRLYDEAEGALEALEVLLGGGDWFLGVETPGVLDADVFSYTYLLKTLAWTDGELKARLDKFGKLTRHAERLYERCWGS